jgi:hypothetical protein
LAVGVDEHGLTGGAQVHAVDAGDERGGLWLPDADDVGFSGNGVAVQVDIVIASGLALSRFEADGGIAAAGGEGIERVETKACIFYPGREGEKGSSALNGISGCIRAIRDEVDGHLSIAAIYAGLPNLVRGAGRYKRITAKADTIGAGSAVATTVAAAPSSTSIVSAAASIPSDATPARGAAGTAIDEATPSTGAYAAAAIGTVAQKTTPAAGARAAPGSPTRGTAGSGRQPKAALTSTPASHNQWGIARLRDHVGTATAGAMRSTATHAANEDGYLRTRSEVEISTNLRAIAIPSSSLSAGGDDFIVAGCRHGEGLEVTSVVEGCMLRLRQSAKAHPAENPGKEGG